MSSFNARSHAVHSVATNRRDAEHLAGTLPSEAGTAADPTEYFGCNVFDDKAMRRYLPKNVYKSLRKTIDHAFGHIDVSRGERYITGYEFALVDSEDHQTNITPEFLDSVARWKEALDDRR